MDLIPVGDSEQGNESMKLQFRPAQTAQNEEDCESLVNRLLSERTLVIWRRFEKVSRLTIDPGS